MTITRPLATLAAACLAVASLAIAHPAAAADRTVVLTGYTTVPHGRAAVLTAVLYDGYTTVPGAVLAVQQRTAWNAPWTAAGTVRTAAGGRAAVTVRPGQNTDYRVVHAPAGRPAAASGAVPVAVAPLAAIRTDRAATTRDGTAVLSGTVRPAAAGTRVQIEWLDPATGRWTPRADAPVAADGTWRRPLVHGLPGTARFRARTAPTARYAQSTSADVAVAVNRASARQLPEWLFPHLHQAVPPEQVPRTNVPGCRPTPGLTHFKGAVSWTVYGTDRADTLCGLPGATTLVALAGGDTVKLGADPGPVVGEDALLGPGDDTATVVPGFAGGPDRLANKPHVMTGAVVRHGTRLHATWAPTPGSAIVWADTGQGNDLVLCKADCRAREGDGNDAVYGPPRSDYFIAEGGLGDDVLFGSRGAGTLEGGPGSDVLVDVDTTNGDVAVGGPGFDVAVLRDGNPVATDSFHGQENTGFGVGAAAGPCAVQVKGDVGENPSGSVSCSAGKFSAAVDSNGTLQISRETPLGPVRLDIENPLNAQLVRATLNVPRDTCLCDKLIKNSRGFVIQLPDNHY